MNEWRFSALLKEKLEELNTAPRLRMYALNFAEASYGWGKESITSTDCSGLLSGALQFMGYNIRTTADKFYKVAFKDTDRSFDKDRVTCIFFLDGDNHAGHMGLHISADVVLHASGSRGVTFDSKFDLMDEYDEKGYTPITLELDWEALEELDGEVSGLDADYV